MKTDLEIFNKLLSIIINSKVGIRKKIVYTKRLITIFEKNENNNNTSK